MKNIMIAGHGKVPRSDVIKNIEKYTGDIEGGFRLLIPISQEQSRSALWAAEWAQTRSHPYNVIIDAEELDERQDSVVQSSVRESSADDATAEAVKSIDRGSCLLIAWNDDEESEKIVTAALSRGASVYDLSDMSELTSEDEDDPEVEEESDDDDFPTVYVQDETSEILRDIQRQLAAIEKKIDDLTNNQRIAISRR